MVDWKTCGRLFMLPIQQPNTAGHMQAGHGYACALHAHILPSAKHILDHTSGLSENS